MDIAAVIGLVSGLFFIAMSILMALQFQVAGLIAYVDWPSVMCTFGGTVAGVLSGYPLPKTIAALKAFKIVIFPPLQGDAKAIIDQIIQLANVARKEGILALEEAAQAMEEKFLQKGLLLIVDGTDPELVRSILETELSYMEARHKAVTDTWDYIADMGPAWGLIGTLIGLVNMLNNLSDVSALGPNMAVAILTTFYGSVIANYLSKPVSKKMSFWNSEEVLLKELMIEGMLSIQAGENPRLIEEKLKSFLSPDIRSTVGEAAGGGGDTGAGD